MARRGTPNNTVDGRVWSDANNHVLAASLGIRPADVIGRFLMLEHHCMSKLTVVVTAKLVDVIMGDGAAEGLVALGMVTELEGGMLEMGDETKAKVEQWRRAHVGKVAGGQAAAEKAEREGRGERGQFRSARDNDTSRTPADHPAPDEQTTGSPPARDQPSASASASASPRAEAEKNPPLPPKGGRARKVAKAGPTPEERELAMRVLAAITERTGVAYQGSEHHLKLIAGRMRDGVSYRDLRSIVAFAWAKSGLNWREKADGQGVPMARCLKPETLFGPEGIHRYLDQARHWFETVARPAMTAEQLAELGEDAPPRAPPAPAEPPANVLPLRRVP